ncbi:hypothetical protein VFPPC_15376 [Pochonia chlamydosporia 170]|uniref:Uncharacterized protein n=1 Tax=Pochonia chlamydosporia 170 TaxID=1380566 RepID=A0A179G7V4_METCM|nr:hypothetical protein VFPPC_15376 [Pochonia chlamydosporia 170]OAQ73884.1 hypothetical protein VFPPC_15376 [Pochonia chlamydosporia 170]
MQLLDIIRHRRKSEPHVSQPMREIRSRIHLLTVLQQTGLDQILQTLLTVQPGAGFVRNKIIGYDPRRYHLCRGARVYYLVNVVEFEIRSIIIRALTERWASLGTRLDISAHGKPYE